MDNIDTLDFSRLVNSLIISLPLFIFAVRLLSRKALVVSALKVSILIGVTTFTGFFLMLLIQDRELDTSYGLLIPIVFMLSVLILFLRNWIVAFNVEESSLREGAITILQRLGIKFSESSGRFILNETSTVLEILYVPSYSSTLIHYNGKLPSSFLPELQTELKSGRIRKTNWLALIVFIYGLFFLNMGLSKFLPDNGMGLSSIPYGRSLTPGELLLSRTLILIPLGFMLYGFWGAVLGIRLLNRRPLLLSPWWFFVPFSFPVLVFVFRAIGFQIIYGFDFSDSVFALFMASLVFVAFLFGRTYLLFNITQDDFLDSLKDVSIRHNISHSLSNSRIILADEKNFVSLTPAKLSTAAISIDPKSFPDYKVFLSNLRAALNKKRLSGFSGTGLLILLISLGFLGLWFLPIIVSFIFDLISK
jgi:hypothetical protein